MECVEDLTYKGKDLIVVIREGLFVAEVRDPKQNDEYIFSSEPKESIGGAILEAVDFILNINL